MAATMMSSAVLPGLRTALPTQKHSTVVTPLTRLPSAFQRRANDRACIAIRAGPLDKILGGKADVDTKAKKINTPESGFTRTREIVTGRLAMTGFFAEVIGELFTGKGAVGQLNLETLVPRPLIGGIILSVVAWNFVTALNPEGPTFQQDNQRDVNKRPKGGVQDPRKNLVSDPKETLGITNFGFTKANELFVGRVAMIGFAASLVGEYFQGGKGPLGQLGIPMPAYANLAAYGLAGWVLFFFAAAVGTGNFPGETEGGEDVY